MIAEKNRKERDRKGERQTDRQIGGSRLLVIIS